MKNANINKEQLIALLRMQELPSNNNGNDWLENVNIQDEVERKK
jgi:hypothetical protein